MRRVGVVLLAFAFAAPAAGAATIHKYAGHAILPPALPDKAALADLNDSSNTLIELDRVGAPMAAAVLRANGAHLLAPQLDLWRVSSLRAQRILPSLMRLGLVRSVTPDRRLHTFAATNQYTDPLVQYEWWIPAIGADKFDPPGPGAPLTIIDSGLDVSHPEFAARPNTTTLNAQDFSGDEQWHGTAVAYSSHHAVVTKPSCGSICTDAPVVATRNTPPRLVEVVASADAASSAAPPASIASESHSLRGI